MSKKQKKKPHFLHSAKIELYVMEILLEAADQVATWDHKTRSEYIRGLILEDVRRRGALSKGGEK